MKPGSKIYEVCEQRANCVGEKVFFTDDRAENIAAAQERGWTTYHFTSSVELTERLRDWLGA